jgi:two-component sensor histidine kinase
VGGPDALAEIFETCRKTTTPLPHSLSLITSDETVDIGLRAARLGAGAVPEAAVLMFAGRDSRSFRSLTDTVTQLRRESLLHRAAAAQLREALSSNELLLRELRHRVKNNVAIIQSLMGRLARRTNHGAVREAMSDMSFRLGALFAAQQHIFTPDHVSDISLRKLLSPIAEAIAGAAPSQPALNLDIPENLIVSSEVANSLALIANEVLCNSVKHAVADALILTIAAKEDGQVLVISFCDNGHAGLSDAPPKQGLGSQLIEGLSRQIGASVAQTFGEKGCRTEVVLKRRGNA